MAERGGLSPKDLVTVLTELITFASHWNNIGLQLGLDQGTLDAITGPFKGNKACMREMLQQWLCSTPNPTWKAIIDALTSPLVDIQNQEIIQHLKATYCTPRPRREEPAGQEEDMEEQVDIN